MLNNKFSTSLFLEKIDMEDINAVVENNHSGNYEVKSDVRFDKRSGNLIMHTKMMFTNVRNGASNLLDQADNKGISNKEIIPPIQTVKSTPTKTVEAPVTAEAIALQAMAKSRSGSKFHLLADQILRSTNTEETAALPSDGLYEVKISEEIESHKKSHDNHSNERRHSKEHPHEEKVLGKDYYHAPEKSSHQKLLLDHSKLLFPHVVCLDGKVKAITHDDSFKYFGDSARVAFFEQYRRMCDATSRVTARMDLGGERGDGGSVSSPNASIVSSYGFEDEDDTFTNDGYTVRTQNTTNTGAQHSVATANTFKSMFQKDDASACSIANVSSVMGKLSSEYYTTFESMVNKDKVKLRVDKEIFAINSFSKYKLRPYVKRKDADCILLEPLLEQHQHPQQQQQQQPLSRRSTASRGSDFGGSRSGSRGRTRSRGDSIVMQRNLISQQADRTVVTQFSRGNPPTAAMALNELVPVSPRTKYLSGCIRDGLQPMPNLVLRKGFTTSHNLAHFGIGDKMGCVLAPCLKDLPHIESVNLADNNLTDVSMKHLIQALISIQTLQELNLSRNKIDGESSEALAVYVSRADCPLVRLILQSADVDDDEADHFIQCLTSNEHILELDLSSNLLGTAESTSNSGDDVQTGGVSIANFISSESCKLQVLKLAWNSIRATSAKKLAAAVAFNNTLTYLDLSCNGMGYAAGEVLGDSIMENRTLKTLLLANNNFTSTSCISICVGVAENLAMKTLSLDENPIGVMGGKIMMQTSIVLGSRVTLTAGGSNMIAQDARCWYDPSMPCRDYQLNLSEPFHRAVAFHLLQTVATHSTLIFSNFMYEPPSGGKATKLQLVQSLSTDRENYFDEEQKNVLKGLRLLLEAASNSALGTKLFYEADEDNSGRLDKDELQNVLDKIGFSIDSDRLQDILAVFDVDGAGTIDLAEFKSLLKSQHHEAASRIKEMTNYPILALSTSPGVKYIPPRSGVIYCSVADGFVRKKNFYMITSTDQQYAYKMAKGIGDVAMMSEATKNSKLRMNEAYAMFKMMYKDVGDKVDVLVQVLPQMMYPHEARQLVFKVTHDERIQLARLRTAFGLAMRPIFGSYNGYYNLDLSKELHRECFSRLLEQSQTNNSLRAIKSIIGVGKCGDTSQHGNWTSFRNEFFNGKPIAITTQMFTPMPHYGILEFDFSGGTRPSGGELRLTDKRMCKVLTNLCILTPEKIPEAMHSLHLMKVRARQKSKDGKLFMPMYQMKVQKALEMGLATDDFYDNLPDRREFLRKGARKEEIKVIYMFEETEESQETSAIDEAGGASDGEDVEQSGDKEVPVGAETANVNVDGDGNGDGDGDVDNTDTDAFNSKEDCHNINTTTDDGSDGEGREGEGESRPGTVGGNEQLLMRQRRIKEVKHRLQALLHTKKKGVSIQARAKMFVDAIEEAFQQLWILSRHLALLVQLFQSLFGDVAKTPYFGSYCAEMVVLLFSRVVDLHNFEIVLAGLSARDCACVFCRIGFLNIFNPMKPEVTMEVDLRRREERLIAKMIVYLSVDEPGINLTYKRFQWKRELDPTPGWELTDPWFTEEGLHDHGKFAFTYYSGEGCNRSGCFPNIQLRKALTHLTLIDENEIIDEDAMLPDELVCTAEAHFEENSQVWTTYLAPSTDGTKKRKT